MKPETIIFTWPKTLVWGYRRCVLLTIGSIHAVHTYTCILCIAGMVRPRYGDLEDVYCCCEYQTAQGSRAHILQCCCDCEAVDTVCER